MAVAEVVLILCPLTRQRSISKSLLKVRNDDPARLNRIWDIIHSTLVVLECLVHIILSFILLSIFTLLDRLLSISCSFVVLVVYPPSKGLLSYDSSCSRRRLFGATT